jgi:hypothetical protein
MTDPITVQDAIELAIARVEADTSKVSADIRNSTVILNGEIADPGARDILIASVLHITAVERVIDSINVRGESNSTRVYMKKGDHLTKALNDYFGDGLTWDRYKAAKRRG